MMEVLPEPVGPTSATTSRGFTSKLTSCRTGRAGS